MERPFELTILGSSSAIPTSQRFPTAQVLNILGRFFLIDCGEGTQIQIRRQKVAFGKIRRICISHLHGDHYYGLIGLISTFNLLGLQNDLHIYSPSQLIDIIQPQLSFLKGAPKFKVIFHPLNFKKPQLIFEDKLIEVFSFPLKHSINCCGFLFKEKPKDLNIKKECIRKYNLSIAEIKNIKQGSDFIAPEGVVIPNKNLTIRPLPPRSYAFCSDTIFKPDIAKFIKGVNLLYHETTFTEDLRDWAEKTYHSTALDAAKIAQMAEAKKLIVGHFSARYKDASPFLKEAKKIFRNTVLAEDGEKHCIEG